MTNKKFQAIIKELFIRYRKLSISLVFITQSYFSVPKDVRSNSTHYLIMKINNILQTLITKIYRECRREPYSFLTIDAKLPASDPLKI